MKEKSEHKEKKSTPVMRQFWDAKKSHPDSIMLFRMGDFYETFDEDAKIASDILGLALTKRSNGAASSVPLAGFPYHSLDQYLHKLLLNGYKVAICEQVEDPKLAKGIVKREVVEVLSPGTAIAEKFLDQKENNFLCSMNFLKNEISFSILDYSTGEFSAGTMAQNQFYDIITKYKISEIILPEKQKPIIDNFKINNVLVTTFNDWIAEPKRCYESLLEHFGTRTLKGFGFDKKDSALISAGCALEYVKSNYFGRVEHITSMSKIKDDESMKIDSSTLKNLEIFQSFFDKSVKGTLIDSIDYTQTSMGSRLLSSHIAKPLLSSSKINNRLKMIDEYMEFCLNDNFFEKKLKNISDIPRIVSKISTKKSNPRDFINLSESLSSILEIKQHTQKTKKIKKMFLEVKNVKIITSEINKILKLDAPVNMSKGGYVNLGVSNELDDLRLISENANKWLVNYQLNLQDESNIPSLKIGYNKVFGYYIDVTKTHVKKIPEYFIRKQTLTNSERYFTKELKDYEEKILSASDKIIQLENEIFDKLTSFILNYIKYIQENSKIIAKFDVIASHAINANKNNYIKPNINTKSTLYEIYGSRHPVIEKILPNNEKFITNDLHLNKKKHIAIITGPNMAGKSTFLRQIGLISILAQIGSFVPAKKAFIPIIDQLFTRVGASDNLAKGESTFLVEMNETANILNNATSKSLIILDEIGRGTSTYDGLSLAWSITEYIHNNPLIKANTLFATHYHELIQLANDLPDAFNLNISVKEYNEEIIFLRKIVEGGASKSYGINVAKMAGLPKHVIDRSKELLAHLTKNKEKKESSIHQGELFKPGDILLDELSKINVENISPIQALNILNSLKEKIKNDV